MPIIERLSRKQIEECLSEAINRSTPVALSCHLGNQWFNCHTRILRQSGEKLWLEHPASEQDQVPEMTADLPIGLSFKIRHHKHVFSSLVVSAGRFQLEDGPEVLALCATRPSRMQRIQRRAYNRVDVPRNRSALATFWRGGVGGPPNDLADRSLTWEGWVTNISAGGFQVRTTSQGSLPLEVNDVVGVRIDLGQEYDAILAEAQFRQETCGERGVTLLGFQFVGLNDSSEGRETLRCLGRIVCDFQRLQGRRRTSSVA